MVTPKMIAQTVKKTFGIFECSGRNRLLLQLWAEASFAFSRALKGISKSFWHHSITFPASYN